MLCGWSRRLTSVSTLKTNDVLITRLRKLLKLTSFYDLFCEPSAEHDKMQIHIATSCFTWKLSVDIEPLMTERRVDETTAKSAICSHLTSLFLLFPLQLLLLLSERKKEKKMKLSNILKPWNLTVQYWELMQYKFIMFAFRGWGRENKEERTSLVLLRLISSLFPVLCSRHMLHSHSWRSIGFNHIAQQQHCVASRSITINHKLIYCVLPFVFTQTKLSFLNKFIPNADAEFN